MKFQFVFVVSCIALLLNGCSTTKFSKDILSEDVPESNYVTYNCYQIQHELRHVSSRLAEVEDVQDSAKRYDQNMAALAWLIFWPAVFAIDNEDHGAEIAMLKGQQDALTRVNESRCMPHNTDAGKVASNEVVTTNAFTSSPYMRVSAALDATEEDLQRRAVTKMQTTLKANRYYSGPINGFMDEKTYAAVMKYKKEKTGSKSPQVFDPETLQLFGIE